MAEAQCGEAHAYPGLPTDAQIDAFIEGMDITPESNLIGVLQRIQEHFAFLPARALQQVSERTRVRLSRIYGVVTFYSQFHTEPRGRHTVRLCSGTACHVRGARRVQEAARSALRVNEGESTEDLVFYFETVACLGACFLAPAMMIDDQYFGRLTPRQAERILESYRAGKL